MTDRIVEQDGIVIVQNFDHRDAPSDERLGAEIGMILTQHFGGWGWYVDIPPNQDIVVIKNFDLDIRGRRGFIFHKSSFHASDFKKKIIMAAGELLERYKVRATRLTDQIDVTKLNIIMPET